ncbi:hypothetical protein Peur_037118 [Populus x canadensis]
MEIDATLPYVQEFEINSPLSAEPITVIVDYEWKPSCCDKCKKSRMDSLGTTSESSHTAPEATVETSSTFMATHDASPNSSPKIVWKKKGGKKQKEVKGL